MAPATTSPTRWRLSMAVKLVQQAERRRRLGPQRRGRRGGWRLHGDPRRRRHLPPAPDRGDRRAGHQAARARPDHHRCQLRRRRPRDRDLPRAQRVPRGQPAHGDLRELLPDRVARGPHLRPAGRRRLRRADADRLRLGVLDADDPRRLRGGNGARAALRLRPARRQPRLLPGCEPARAGRSCWRKRVPTPTCGRRSDPPWSERSATVARRRRARRSAPPSPIAIVPSWPGSRARPASRARTRTAGRAVLGAGALARPPVDGLAAAPGRAASPRKAVDPFQRRHPHLPTTRDGAAHASAALGDQRFDDFEVVVAVDGSTDGTAEAPAAAPVPGSR